MAIFVVFNYKASDGCLKVRRTYTINTQQLMRLHTSSRGPVVEKCGNIGCTAVPGDTVSTHTRDGRGMKGGGYGTTQERPAGYPCSSLVREKHDLIWNVQKNRRTLQSPILLDGLSHYTCQTHLGEPLERLL
ncbi:hypothetical protein DL96DRAFT_1554447 [Flagelloscypha sp. PMI_526]|nr:hypothetical protein DL96DRAFT_1554447 [Flagelloscypha sp. PMI_526]